MELPDEVVEDVRTRLHGVSGQLEEAAASGYPIETVGKMYMRLV